MTVRLEFNALYKLRLDYRHYIGFELNKLKPVLHYEHILS
jgi:hypothetical protein